MRTPEERAARAGRIGSTGIAALTGHSPWVRPIDVYRAAVEGWEPEPSEQMEIGELMEPVAVELYRRRTDRAVRKGETLLHHNGVTVDTPDAIAWHVTGEVPRAVEAKTCVGWKYDQWGEPGTDEVPAQYLIQSQWHMMHLRQVSGFDTENCDIPVLIGGCKFAVYTVQWDKDLAASLMEIAAKFHRDHIAKRVPPPVDDSQAYRSFLKDTYPLHRGEVKPADSEYITLAEQLRMARQAAKEAEAWKTGVENRIKARLGDVEGVYGPDFKLTWRAQKDGKRVLRFKDVLEAEND